jgi:hypothetical protein
MPNWCEGTLKVRGEQENIKRFLTEGLEAQNYGAAIAQMVGKPVEEKLIEVEESEYSFTVRAEEGFYLKGSRRHFIEGKEIEWYLDNDVLVIPDFKAAWGIDPLTLVDVSNKYQIDLNIYAYERGMEFNQRIEVHKGNLIKNEEIKFDDYAWECPEPHIGG